MVKKYFAYTFFLFLFLVFFSQMHSSEAITDFTERESYVSINESTKDWTILVYMCADNNLEPFGIDDINEMELGGGTNNDVNVVVMVDRSSFDYEAPYYPDDWSETRYYVVKPDTDMDVITSPINTSLGEQNMGNPLSLTNFVDWGLSAFPADRTALIIWDHGGGLDGTCWDDGDYDFLTINEIQTALSGYHFDIIGFDACVMGQIEIVYELRESCDVVITSLYTEPGDGWAYDDIVSYLISDPLTSVESFASYICTSYVQSYLYDDVDVTLSAYNTSIIANLIPEINSLANELSGALSGSMSDIYDSIAAAKSYDPFFVTEFYEFLTEVSTRVGGAVGTAANNLKTELDSALIASESSLTETPYGLWVFLPFLPYNYSFEFYSNPLDSYVSSYENIYYGLDFVEDSNWELFLSDWQLALDSHIPSVNYPSAYSDTLSSSEYIFLQADLPANTLGYAYQAELTMEYTLDLDMFVWTEEYYYGLSSGLFLDVYFGYEGETEYATIPLTHATTVFFFIYPYSGSGSFSLSISEIEYNEDMYEENDDINSAAYLEVNAEYDLYLNDAEFFEVELIEGQMFDVTLELDYINYDMDLFVYNATGHLIDFSEEYDIAEQITFIAPYTGSYYIEVYLFSGEFGGLYTLTLTALNGPFITQVFASPYYVYEGDAITITATIQGVYPLEQVILSYLYSNSLTWTNITMTLASDGNYTATIPGETGVSYIDVYIYAQDNNKTWAIAGAYSIDIYEDTGYDGIAFPWYVIPLSLLAIGLFFRRKKLKS